MKKRNKQLKGNAIYIEMFPESFNELRRQLYEKHQDIWQDVQGYFTTDGMRVAYMFRILNDKLGTTCTLDMTIDAACTTWLRALEKRQRPQIILPPGYLQ